MTMLINDAYKLIRTFCTRALAGKRVNVSSTNQDANRRSKPFISIEIDNCKDVTTFNEYVDDSGVKTFEKLKTIDVTFTAFTDELFAAEDYLCSVYNMLATELTFEIFGRNIAYLHKLQDITCASTVVSGKIENRAMMELRFNMMQTAQFETGFIERVEVTDEITNSQYII